MTGFTFSVIVTTYNAPRELDLVLCGLSRQSRKPDEVLIADDGSSEETGKVLGSWAKSFECGLTHVWHVDRGFRKTRIVNEAVRRSKGDHLVFLDGDSVPHSRWLQDHIEASGRSRILCGRRVRLGPKISGELNCRDVSAGVLEAPLGPVFTSLLGGGTKRYLLGLRLPQWMARGVHPRPRRLMGVNFSLPREAFERVNGYDEEWIDYQREDRDLELRLLRAGYSFYPLLNRAVVYHLYHPMRPVSDETEARVKAQEASTRIRCERGLYQEEAFDPNR